MKAGDRHLGWSVPSQKIHAVTVTWTGKFGDDEVLTARADCGRAVTAVLEKTEVEFRSNLCKKCGRVAGVMK